MICGGDDAERERERVELVKLLPFGDLSVCCKDMAFSL